MESKPESTTIELTGSSLSLQDVIDVSLGRKESAIATGDEGKAVRAKIEASIRFLQEKLHTPLYGITTGFGGSGDTRSSDPIGLQLAMLESVLCGVVRPKRYAFGMKDRTLIPPEGIEGALPTHVVRASMLIRANSLLRGHSAVRLPIIETLLAFLRLQITPVVPSRGSISASGDLTPLGYVAAALCGHESIWCTVPSSSESGFLELLPVTAAFERFSHLPRVLNDPSSRFEPVTFGPKEGLGLVNGTGTSTGAICFALWKAQKLLKLAQVTTAMTLEATKGALGSFDEFLHDTARPHPGQVAVACNVRKILAGSKLAQHHEQESSVRKGDGILIQDRYALRTSAQWFGPTWEEFEGAKQSLEVELNSTTDNPLIQAESGQIHQGGNFQAMSPSLVSEKVRLCLALIGKIAFAQTTELFNASMNRGLPSCLAGSEPSTNFHAKGLDYHAAAYCSELQWLGSPVTTHVQSAEMHNQAVNSLALISGRKTLESCDVLTLLLATQLYGACQATDLRVIDERFRSTLFTDLIPTRISKHFPSIGNQEQIQNQLRDTVGRRLDQSNTMDLKKRMEDLWKVAEGDVLAWLKSSGATNISIGQVEAWKEECISSSIDIYINTRDPFYIMKSRSIEEVGNELGDTTKEVYLWVRETVGIATRRGDMFEGKSQESIGTHVGMIVDGLETDLLDQNPVLNKLQ